MGLRSGRVAKWFVSQLIYNIHVGEPGKSGPLAQVWKWLCEVAADRLSSPTAS